MLDGRSRPRAADEYLCQPVREELEIGVLVAEDGEVGGADPQPRSLSWRARIAWNEVAIGKDAERLEPEFGLGAREPERSQVEQEHVTVRAARDQLDVSMHQRL